MTVDRFRDPDLPWVRLAETVAVRCPRCARRVDITVAPDAIASWPTATWSKRHSLPRRLACSHCAYAATWPTRGQGPVTAVWGAPRDPWFGAELWFSGRCVGHVLWAYNAEHLVLLRDFVRADHRHRNPVRGRNMTMLARLPAWMKLAKHRAEVVATIERLLRT